MVLIFVPLLCIAQNGKQVIAVDMVNELIIGGDASKPVEYSFDKPRDIDVDNSSNIYVADEGSMSIKVFNQTGKFIKTIGRRGRGPGEFLSLRALNINSDGELLVVNGLGFRVTKFNLEGEVLDTYSMSKKTQDIVFFNQLFRLSSEKHLILYKKFGPVGNEDEIFHVWEKDFTNRIYNFGSFKQLDFDEGFETVVARAGVGSMFLKGHKKLLFAPISYKGFIYEYEKKENQWTTGKNVHGYNQLPKPSYKIIQTIKQPTPAKIKKNRDVSAPIELYTQNGVFKGDIYTTSAGIFTLNNGCTVHFSFIKTQGRGEKDKGTWKLGAELFDKNLKYLGYFSLSTFNDIYTPLFPAIKTKDKDDNFYMISQEGYPVVRKFSLDIQYK